MPVYSEMPTTAQLFGMVVKWSAIAITTTIALLCIFAAVKIWLQLQDLPPLSSLGDLDRGDPIQIFDRYDHLVVSIKGGERRQRVSLRQISPAMRWACVAAEDHKFYEHKGFSPLAILRALLANVHAGHVVEGGSTITQQLVKNLFFGQSGRTLDRKAAELYVAFEMEHRFSKDQILEMYLNEAYFGNGAYGVEQAARYYFAKPAALLKVSESAFLAGLIKSPSRLGAPSNRAQAIICQLETIDRMVRFGFISPLQAEQAKYDRLSFWEREEPVEAEVISKYPYYISYVLDLVRQRFTPGEIRRQGLRVYTALDPNAQQIAEKSLAQGIAHAPPGVDQGALVTVAVKDGSIIALVGGVGEFAKHQYNSATHGHTAGSAFKPFVYLCAFENQVLNADSEVDDSALCLKFKDGTEWKPKNFDGKYTGVITVREALANSRNVCAVRAAQRVGIENVVQTAQRLGIHTLLEPNLSLALGSAPISPLEMAGAYATIARGGLVIYPWVLRRVDNRNGHVLQTFDQPVSRSFAPDLMNQMSDLLREVVTNGTGREAAIPGLYVAGKTGTSDQAKDLWFVGYTPDLVTAVWGGNEKGLPIAGTNTTGGTVMARIWKLYTSVLYDNQDLARNGLIRHIIAFSKAAAATQKSEYKRAQVTRLPNSEPARSKSSASTKIIESSDGNKIILRMQQGKLDERTGGDAQVKFKL